MDENHQDKTGTKPPAIEDKVSVTSEQKIGIAEHNGTRRRVNSLAWLFKTWASPIGIGTLIAVGTLLWGVITFNLQQRSSQLQAEQQFQSDQLLALDQQEAATLQTYIDNIENLLLNHDLLKSKWTDDIAIIARVRTLTALDGLDAHRKGVLLKFLYEAGLIGFADTAKLHDRIIYLWNADLSNADLKDADLRFADFTGADLSNANLSKANLVGVSFEFADLSNANLSKANLNVAFLVDSVGLTQQQLDQVSSCKDAILPKGLTCHHNQ
jgi:uncharacterized protein YjbI with pentapeptide repeats